jgi:hypothetical protein
MTPKLTSEQRDALSRQGSPVAVEDEQTRRVYFLVDPAMLDAIRDETDMAAILQGVADAESGDVQPLDETFRQIEHSLRTRFGQ